MNLKCAGAKGRLVPNWEPRPSCLGAATDDPAVVFTHCDIHVMCCVAVNHAREANVEFIWLMCCKKAQCMSDLRHARHIMSLLVRQCMQSGRRPGFFCDFCPAAQPLQEHQQQYYNGIVQSRPVVQSSFSSVCTFGNNWRSHALTSHDA